VSLDEEGSGDLRYTDTKENIWGRRTCEHRGRDWSDVSVKQGMLKIVTNHQKLGKGHRMNSLSKSTENSSATDALISDSGPQNCERIHFCCFKPQNLW
jgi:hypothetical protein